MDNISDFKKIEIEKRAEEISRYWGDPRFSNFVDQEIATLNGNEFEIFLIAMGEMMDKIKNRQDRIVELCR